MMSIVPLPLGQLAPDDGDMTLIVISDHDDTERLATRHSTPWLRVLTLVLSSTLDRQLASGCRPEFSRLLAARAVRLASPSMRAEVARSWERVLAQARRPPVAITPRVPFCRDRIVAAEDAVLFMLGALSASRPVPARGVAMAIRLLSDGTGPLYNRNSGTDLLSALREVTAQLDP
jgi:hypothetical protein